VTEFATADLEDRWHEADALEPVFERFYRDHYAFVWRSARRMLAGAGGDQVEDVIQDTWIAAYRRFDSFDGECRPTTWLFGILRNVARNHGRGERRRTRRIAAFVAHNHGRDLGRESDDAGRLLGQHLLERFLSTLDEDKRAVFVLAELEGHSGREIAAALHINANTAHSRLRAARQQFCAYFDLPHSREEIAARTRSLRERPEQPSTQALVRSRALLIVGIGKGTLVTSGGGGVGLALIGKIVAAIAALLVAGAGVLAAEHTPNHEELEIPTTREVGPQKARELASPAVVELASSEPDELAPIPVPAPVARKITRPDPYELVRQARKALVEGQAAQALELLAGIPSASPTARGERAATEIAALCRLDRPTEARAVAEAFALAEPGSPLLLRLDSACW
jgi:RNA polymerase sigma factor (sigma-70 family)